MLLRATATQGERRCRNTAKGLRKRLEALQEPFKGLAKYQVSEVMRVAMKFQQENKKAQEQSQSIRREQAKNTPDRGQSR